MDEIGNPLAPNRKQLIPSNQAPRAPPGVPCWLSGKSTPNPKGKTTMKKKTTDTIQKQLVARQTELKTTFAEMTRAINANIPPRDFMYGDDASPGEPLFIENSTGAFNKFYHWVERWMGSLFPRTILNQQKIVNIADLADVDAVYMELAYDAKRFGFVLGYLVGCQSMGADFQTLTAKAEGFIVQDIGWRKWNLQCKAQRERA